MAKPPCPMLTYGKRITHLGSGAGAFYFDLRLDAKSKSRPNHHVPVFDVGAGTDARPVLSQPVGMNNNAPGFCAPTIRETDKLVEKFADSFARFDPIKQ